MNNLLRMLVEKGYKPTFSKFETDYGPIYQLEVGGVEVQSERFEGLEPETLWRLDLDKNL